MEAKTVYDSIGLLSERILFCLVPGVSVFGGIFVQGMERGRRVAHSSPVFAGLDIRSIPTADQYQELENRQFAAWRQPVPYGEMRGL
jgi:hypothetical protein